MRPSLLVAFAALSCHATPVPETAAPPNIVLINADDLGFGDLGSYGAKHVTTPNLDRLAREGRRFTDAHSASAVCSPSRYGLLTGRYPFRRNLWGPVGLRLGLTIDPERTTIASVLKNAGYDTACIGKWHLGFGDPKPDWNGALKPGPCELGFDSYFGIPNVNSGPPFVYVENHRVVGAEPDDPLVYGKLSATKRMPEKGGYRAIGGAALAHRLYDDEQVGTTLRARAIQWLEKRDGDTPFFLYLATTNIHHPFTPAPRFVGTSKCGRYGDFIHELDWIVGGILDTLDEIGATDNTLVIFTSDNGGMLNVTAQKAWRQGHRINGDLLGFKFGAWEGGHRVPFLVRWPGRVPADTTSDHLLGHVDLLATFAAIVGRTIPKGHGEDSLDQLKTWTGSPEVAVRDTLALVPNSPRHLGLRSGSWVLIPARGAGGFQGKKAGVHLFSGAAALPFAGRTNSDVILGEIRSNAPVGQLYDLSRDPRQTTNLYTEHPEIVRRLRAKLDEFRSTIPRGRPVGWINLKQ